MAMSFKGAHFPQDIILMGVRWYLAYPLSYRHVEELMEERGVAVDHATIQRWVVSIVPSWKRPSIGASGRYGSAGVWTRHTIGSKASGGICIVPSTNTGRRLTFCSRRIEIKKAALRFLKKAIRRQRAPRDDHH